MQPFLGQLSKHAIVKSEIHAFSMGTLRKDFLWCEGSEVCTTKLETMGIYRGGGVKFEGISYLNYKKTIF